MDDDAILEVIAKKLRAARQDELLADAKQLQIQFRDWFNMDGPRPCLYEGGARRDGGKDEFKASTSPKAMVVWFLCGSTWAARTCSRQVVMCIRRANFVPFIHCVSQVDKLLPKHVVDGIKYVAEVSKVGDTPAHVAEDWSNKKKSLRVSGELAHKAVSRQPTLFSPCLHWFLHFSTFCVATAHMAVDWSTKEKSLRFRGELAHRAVSA